MGGRAGWRAPVAMLLLVTATACGGSSRSDEPAATTPPTATSTATSTAAPPSPTSRPVCAGSDDGNYWVPPGADGDQGAVLILGKGTRGVLLAPQSDGDICQWIGQGRRLAAVGYRVAMFNWGPSLSGSMITGARRLREQGAQRIVLAGASRGGAYALGLAAQLKPAGVISLSGEAELGELDNYAAIRGYDGPVLFVGSENDVYTPGTDTRRLARNHPGREQVIVVPGAAHGLELLTDSDLLDAFDNFLRQTLNG